MLRVLARQRGGLLLVLHHNIAGRVVADVVALWRHDGVSQLLAKLLRVVFCVLRLVQTGTSNGSLQGRVLVCAVALVWQQGINNGALRRPEGGALACWSFSWYGQAQHALVEVDKVFW
jgi:hypothetical protein